MRYAIFSDVHGNLEAFNEVLSFYRKENIDKFIFLGDIVGYGANPNECISLLKDLDPIYVAGNHDWAAIDRLSLEYFNPYAKEAILWAKNKIKVSSLKLLNSFSLTFTGDDFFCVHGSPINPGKFSYVSNLDSATINFSGFKQKICFIGHSHKMEAYTLKQDKLSHSTQQIIKIDQKSKHIINVGSVGQPRDGDPRSCVGIYDTNRKIVKLKRLEYNIKKAAGKIIASGLPQRLAERLYQGY